MGVNRHPMGNYGRSRGGFGCILIFLVLGLLGGGGYLVFATFFQSDTDNPDQAVHDFETAQAMLAGQTMNAPATNQPSTGFATPTLFPTPDISGEVGF